VYAGVYWAFFNMRFLVFVSPMKKKEKLLRTTTIWLSVLNKNDVIVRHCKEFIIQR